MSNKYTLLTFKSICMNLLLKLKFSILGHPVNSKQPHKIVQILLVHPVYCWFNTRVGLVPGGVRGVPLPVVTPLSKDSDGIRLMHKYFYYICLTTWEVRR